MGLHGEMKLQLASGPVRISELSDRSVRNPDYYEIAFIWTGARLYASEVSEFRPKGEEQIFEIELDDGSIVRASASSRLVLQNGDLLTPPEIRPGASLLPLYFGDDHYGYPTYKIPGYHVKQKIYRLMAEWKVGHALQKGTEVKHVDGNRRNYHPSNLLVTPNARRPKSKTKTKLAKAFHDVKSYLEECAELSPLMAEIAGKEPDNNHKVVSIRPSKLELVYTASVRSAGSVSVSGVFLELPA